MLHLKLRQVECAISDGQLDEAYRMIQRDESIRQHRRGQQMQAQLARRFVERGGEHLAAGRLSSALSDCNKADHLHGNDTRVAELRRAVCKAMEERQFTNQRDAQRLAAAQRQIDHGWLSVGEQILDGADDDPARMVLQQAHLERKRAESIVRRVRRAMELDELPEALQWVASAGSLARHDAELSDLRKQVLAMAAERIREFFRSGRLDQAQAMLTAMDGAAGEHEAIRPYRDALSMVRQAASLLAEGQARQAGQMLARVKLVVPEAAWLTDAAQQASTAADQIESLQVGPLGLVGPDLACETQAGARAAGGERPPKSPAAAKPEPAFRAGKVRAAALPGRFILQIDGVGGFLVLRDGRITLGPISSSARPMLAFMAQTPIPTATIERQEEDYLLRSDKPIHVGEQPVTQRVLHDGDKIALSMRCRMKFRRPNAASTTALLQLSSARLPRPDINQVVLMDREILIGPGSGNHVQADQLNETVALYIRDGQLYCRADQPVIVDGQARNGGEPLPMETPIQVGTLSLVLAPDDRAAAGGGVAL